MKRIGVVMICLLAVAGGFCLLIATADRYEFGFVDIQRPTTLLAFVAHRLQAVPGYVRDLVGVIL